MNEPSNNTRPLHGQVSLVTGANRGIGFAVAHALARLGASVAVASRTLHRSETLAKELAATYGVPTLPIELDVTKPPSCTNMAEKLLKRFQRIDIIVNNAGVMYMDQLLDANIDEFTETLGANVGGPFLVTRALVEEMMQRRRGTVINIAAMAGLRGAPFLAAYSASKAALISLTQSWAEELADYGVRFYAVCPDVVDTESLRELVDVGRTPMLSAEDVAAEVATLVTGERQAESGAVIPLEAERKTAETAMEKRGP